MALKRGEELEEAGAAAEAWEAYVDPNALPPLPSLPATTTGDETLLPAQPHVAQDAVVPEATGDLKVVDDDLTIPSSNGHVFPPPPPVDPSSSSSSAHLPTSMDIAVADPSSFDNASKPQSSDIGVDSSNADTFAEGVQVELNGAIGAEGRGEAMEMDVAGAET